MLYKILCTRPDTHFIGIEFIVPIKDQELVKVQLPVWRPGRYEIANFAKNVKSFLVKDRDGNNLSYQKIGTHCWEVNCKGAKELIVSYEYYAFQLDAGASYFTDEQLYLNPVNCFMYVCGRENEACEVELLIPDNYKIACQLKNENKKIYASSFDELADSPFIASDSITRHSFKLGISNIYLWFQGRELSNIEQLIEDTKTYCEAQVKLFKELPCKDFHFMYQIPKFRVRHGVEHCDSTVIALSKDENQLEHEYYDELLAISSHEFFHLWNVKRIRPLDMLPYDFTKENFSSLGYIYEGVTTYYGDLMLLRSGVWNWEQFCTSFNMYLTKHLSNLGRFNYSVAESSIDTWIDGYVPGVQGRKVSIYVEGLMAALIADLMILKGSGLKYSLDDVMRDLYENTFKTGTGYNEEYYRLLLENYGSTSFEKYFEEIIWGRGFFDKYLTEILSWIGCEIVDYTLIIKVQSEEQKEFFNTWADRNFTIN